MSSDMDELAKIASNLESQSLWNRAVSSDTKDKQMSNREEKVSIPLEQGSVFRRKDEEELAKMAQVSIPLEQGSVFRPNTEVVNTFFASQSLWNRAVSSDIKKILIKSYL